MHVTRHYLKSKAYFLTVGACVACVLWIGAQVALNWALQREARKIGGDWARHIEAQLEGLQGAQRPDGRRDKSHVPDPQEVRTLLSSVFAIGHIFQFDYINSNCHCHVSLTADGQSTGESTLPEALHDTHSETGEDGHGHDHASSAPPEAVAVGKIPKGFWRHVVHSNKSHAAPKSNPSSAHQYPVDYILVGETITSKAFDIRIRHDASPEFPSTMAEVYHPVMEGGEVLYLVRVLVDLEDQATLFTQILFMAAVGAALMIGACVGYPTWRYMLIAARRRQADKRVAFLANHDALTNLYNRNNFQETVTDILWSCQEKRQSALFFVFDLNDFKGVNDFYGHQVGDKILCELANTLTDLAPPNSYIARVGGDEFVVIIPGIEQNEFHHSDFLDVPKAVQVNIDVGEQIVASAISCGVARYPQDADSVEELIQLADLALFAAKPYRSGKVCAYEPRHKAEFFDRLNIREEFKAGLMAGQIEPYFQPIVNMNTGMVEGFEALARWNHPEKGLLTPFVFSEVLQDSEITAMLGNSMFTKITIEMAEWAKAGVPFVKVGINVTDGDLRSSTFAQNLLGGLDSRGLLPEQLTIEVTENCLFGSDKQHSIQHLETLRTAGCFIALDDFGTGFSSITQLKELPITTIKIDKSFIDDVLENPDDQSIIGAMLGLGRSMKFDLVMEGIETASQLDLLRRMGSELAQGYFYARPMPAVEVPAFIQRQNGQYDSANMRQMAG